MPSHDISDPAAQRTYHSASYIHFPGADRDPWMLVPAPPPPPVPRPSIPPARLQRVATLIHNLGARPLYELLREILAGRDPVASLEAYAELDADILEAMGADRFPAIRVLS